MRTYVICPSLSLSLCVASLCVSLSLCLSVSLSLFLSLSVFVSLSLSSLSVEPFFVVMGSGLYSGLGALHVYGGASGRLIPNLRPALGQHLEGRGTVKVGI